MRSEADSFLRGFGNLWGAAVQGLGKEFLVRRAAFVAVAVEVQLVEPGIHKRGRFRSTIQLRKLCLGLVDVMESKIGHAAPIHVLQHEVGCRISSLGDRQMGRLW